MDQIMFTWEAKIEDPQCKSLNYVRPCLIKLKKIAQLRGVHTFKPSTEEASKSLSSRPVSPTWGVLGQLWLHSETTATQI